MKGATVDDWLHFNLVLGLGPNLLPCVPYGDDVQVVEGSALKGKIGKIPSTFNGRGEAHGLTDWQKRPIHPAEFDAWSEDRRLNLCVRTGPISGVYAFDIDIDDYRGTDVYDIIHDMLDGVELPLRVRDDSVKMLLLFRMEGSCKKRKIKLDDKPKGPAIELLADGQQLVACGTHSSGSRYRWSPELPSSIPKITLDQLNSIWKTLTEQYAKTPSISAEQTAPVATATTETSSEVLRWISTEDWAHLIECLRFLLPHAADNDTWSEIGYALLSLQVTGLPVRQLWFDFSKKAPGYEVGAPEAWWSAHFTQSPRTDYRHIFNMARQRGMQRVAPVEAFEPVPDATELNVVPDDVPPGKELIRLSGAEFSNIIKRLEEILSPDVYTQGASLVRTSEAHSDGAIQRSADAVMLIPATQGWARIRFGELCDFQKYLATQDAWVAVAPSVEHISTFLDRGSWTVLRPLDAIARAPFLRFDGTICDQPGYDAMSRTLYVPSIEFPPIPESPSREEAMAALARLREPFNEFPWKEAASESAFLSHILSEAARLAMERCPMYFYDAPMAGTGKSTLQEMAARIVHGTEPALRPWVSDEDELRKSLYACLMAGDRSIWFDNVPDGMKVRSSVLEAFLTSAVWKDRKLGESVTSAIPNKTVLVASGNNLTPMSALARRSIVIRLDANTENIRERVFKIANPRTYVMEHRAQLLVDALTIIRAYISLRSFVKMPVPLPSFESWSSLAREPLIWLGLADPVITQLNETDDESQNIGPIFSRLVGNFGEGTFTAGSMARIVGSLSDENNELSDSLMQMGCMEPTNPIKVGYWLRAAKDKIGAGYKLVHDGHSKHGVKWKLQKMNGDLT